MPFRRSGIYGCGMADHVLDPIRSVCILCCYDAETIERLRIEDCPQLTLADEIENALLDEQRRDVDEEQPD